MKISINNTKKLLMCFLVSAAFALAGCSSGVKVVENQEGAGGEGGTVPVIDKAGAVKSIASNTSQEILNIVGIGFTGASPSVAKSIFTGSLHQVLSTEGTCPAGGYVRSEGSFDLLIGEGACSLMFRLNTLEFIDCRYDENTGLDGLLTSHGVFNFACPATLPHLFEPSEAYYQVWLSSEGLDSVYEGVAQEKLYYAYYTGLWKNGENEVNLVDAIFGGDTIQQTVAGGYNFTPGGILGNQNCVLNASCVVGNDAPCKESFGPAAYCRGVPQQMGCCVTWNQSQNICEASPYECDVEMKVALPGGTVAPVECVDNFMQPQNCKGSYQCSHGASCINGSCQCVQRTVFREKNCADGRDDDYDIRIDCKDKDCCYSPSCYKENDAAWSEICEGEKEVCGDGVCSPNEKAVGVNYYYLADMVYCSKDCCPPPNGVKLDECYNGRAKLDQKVDLI